jgi:hypothetical protein
MPSAKVTIAVHQIVQPLPSPRILRLFSKAQCVPERTRLRHLRSMRFHLAPQFLLVGMSSKQVTETTDPLTDGDHREFHGLRTPARAQVVAGIV